VARVRASRSAYYKQWREKNRQHVKEYKKEHPDAKPPTMIVGVDSEGLTLEDGRHICRYLAAWTDSECVSEVENEDGLRPEQVFEFLFAVKRYHDDSILVGFSLGYDYTKWFEGLPTDVIFHLVRPETRRGKHGAKPVRWGRYLLNYLRGKFTVTRLISGAHRRQCDGECEGCKHGESVTIWDVWGFYQGSFIDACMKWAVIDAEEYAELKRMKDARSTFSEAQWEEVKAYCGKECRKLAWLVDKLRKAHIEAELPLKSYYGAGSTASVLLNKMNVKPHMPQEEYSDELKLAIASAFFGGRFEIARIGPLRETCYSYDIASAYPYQLYQLPCMACGKWTHVKDKVNQAVEKARYAIVRYTLPYCEAIKTNGTSSCFQWGPFPLRTAGIDEIDDGCIVYPVTSGGGWVYRAEYLAARDHWPNIEAKEAWIYETDCGHTPFIDIAKVYAERLRWGKDGPGIVLKLGPNSCYGKIAQSIGDKPPFQCFVWAGMITSGCRAQLIELMRQDREAILMTATDGIVSRRKLSTPIPIDTGTFDAAKRYGKEALGAWEAKVMSEGVHMIRPGIAFPLKGKEEETKARGVGKAVLTKHRELVMQSWAEHGPKALTLTSTIFRGMKSATSYVQGQGYKRAAQYGQWVPRTQAVSYLPEPKRPFIVDDDGVLHTWAFNQEVISAPYARILGVDDEPTSEVLALKELANILSEQPDREDSIDEF